MMPLSIIGDIPYHDEAMIHKYQKANPEEVYRLTGVYMMPRGKKGEIEIVYRYQDL